MHANERVINVWNALAADAIDFSSVKKFRCSVVKDDLRSFTKCFFLIFCVTFHTIPRFACHFVYKIYCFRHVV